MLSEKQVETLSTLVTLRKQVELLDSHKNVGMINDKQYAESLEAIVRKLEEIEDEYGLDHYVFTEEELIFNDSSKIFG